MKVGTPAGENLGRVKDVTVDGYGRATYAIVAYGGVMGLGNRYVAIPWTSVAEMLHSDRLVIDKALLENAPILTGARPDSANRSWRRNADNYWRDKLAMGSVPITAPVVPESALTPNSSSVPKERN
jgi:sporulation protein YlmC with PRC-barrel domain